MSVMKRGSQWCLRRRVPAQFHSVETRSEVWISLQTDSRRLAMEKAPAIWEEQLALWKARLSGQDADAVKHFEAVQSLAASKGLRYMPIDQVAQLSTPKIYMRNKRYYIRVQVPRDMQDVIGRKEYCISLGTSDYTVAQAKARDKTEQKRREISQQYARDMKRNRRVDWFSNDECHALISDQCSCPAPKLRGADTHHQ